MVKDTLKIELLSVIGASSERGMRVPDAKASPYTLYGPRGVFLKNDVLIVSDTGNHRVLIWKGVPISNKPADVVLGQRDFYGDSPNAGGDVERGLFMPTGVFLSDDGKLFIADAWNHRILMWEKLPEENFSKPHHVIGQSSLKRIDRDMLFWCFGVYYDNSGFYVCDTGNRRILRWKDIPDSMQIPDDIYEGFSWPHSICRMDNRFFVADAGTGVSKVYVFGNSLKDASLCSFYIGHKEGCDESSLNLPYGVSASDDLLFVADTSNNRVLIFKELEKDIKPIAVVGQRNFFECGENRWERVDEYSLCWPYAVFAMGKVFLVADTGNNRVLIYKLRI